MKKIMTFIIVLALALSLSAPAFAETYTEGDTPKTEVFLTYDIAEPKYTVEIPAKIYLKVNGDLVNLTVNVEGMETLSGRAIVISIANALIGEVSWHSSTDPYNDWLIIENPKAEYPYYKTLSYYIVGASPRLSELAKEPVLKFTEDGSKDIAFSLSTSEGTNIMEMSKICPDYFYSGWVTFGIYINPQPEPPGAPW